MNKHDWLLALVLTIICGVLSFSLSGDTTAPQTFWRATEENPTLTIDLGEDVLLDNILYYTGLENDPDRDWLLEVSVDGQLWHSQPFMSHVNYDIFSWKIPFLEDFPRPVRYIRLTAGGAWKELGELVFFTRDEQGNRIMFDTSSLSERYPEYSALFDEQSLVPMLPDLSNNDMFVYYANRGLIPGRVSDHNGGVIFDEISHVRTAFEYIHNEEPYEITHPPLGKLIIALGINLFGMTPFGWRFMGILFGILMIPVLYIFIKNIFNNSVAATCGAVLLVFENLRFTQSRIATIDTYVVFFILLMYLFMFRFISTNYEAPFKKTVLPLFLCGLSFGLGVATKWVAFYAALGLVFLYTLYLVKRGQHQIAAGEKEQYKAYLLRTILASVVFFVVIPFIIYTLSYIPITAAYGKPITAFNLIRDMWDNQIHMLSHHGDPTRDMSHLFRSSWWMWLLNIRPMFYFADIQDESRALVGALTNPLITIGGLVAMGFVLYDAITKRAKDALFIIVGYLSQLVPWFFIARATFVYHYFPSVIFLILAICYIFNNMLKHDVATRKRVYLFTGISVVLFFMLYPISAGLTVPNWYSALFLRWLPSWPF
jgi:predicted membrane-bound dolichyl-phosphate-mannose-protein mannosyltransferase